MCFIRKEKVEVNRLPVLEFGFIGRRSLQHLVRRNVFAPDPRDALILACQGFGVGGDDPIEALCSGEALARANQGLRLAEQVNEQEMVAYFRNLVQMINVPENFEKFPTAARSRYSSVVPDGLLLAGRFQMLGGVSFNPQGAFLEILDSDFLEVKGRQGPLTLSMAHAQILGLIDALALLRRPSISIMGNQPRPALLLVTTTDTKVDKAVVWEAAKRNVALFQAIVLEKEGWLSVGPFNQLTRFADAPPLFQLESKPRQLEPERR